MTKSVSKLILQKWIADLRDKDKKMSSVGGNFDELIEAWFTADVLFEEAYTLMKEAIKAHLPPISTAKYVYKKAKSKGTEKDFIDGWNKNIEDIAMQTFYEYYPIDAQVTSTNKEAQFGSMSTKEYLKQRRYADSFPTIDPNTISHDISFDEDLFNSDHEDDVIDFGEDI